MARRGKYPEPLNAAVTASMKSNKSKGTKPEVEVGRLLRKRGLTFRRNKAISVEGAKHTPDLVFRTERVAVFIDGCFWHHCPWHGTMPKHNAAYWRPKLRRNRERDKATTKALKRAGWLPLRFWEHLGPEVMADRVCERLAEYGHKSRAAGGRAGQAGGRGAGRRPLPG